MDILTEHAKLMCDLYARAVSVDDAQKNNNQRKQSVSDQVYVGLKEILAHHLTEEDAEDRKLAVAKNIAVGMREYLKKKYQKKRLPSAMDQVVKSWISCAEKHGTKNWSGVVLNFYPWSYDQFNNIAVEGGENIKQFRTNWDTWSITKVKSFDKAFRELVKDIPTDAEKVEFYQKCLALGPRAKSVDPDAVWNVVDADDLAEVE